MHAKIKLIKFKKKGIDDMNDYDISYYPPKKQVAKKEVVLAALIITIPLIIFSTVMILPSYSSDLDMRVLCGDIRFFMILLSFAAAIVISFIIDFILAIIKKSTINIKKSAIPKLVVLLLFCMMAIGSYQRVESALKDYYAEDVYITGIVEIYIPQIDGTRPKVKFINNSNTYDVIQLDVKLKKGSHYRFKYYEYSNLLYIIEEITE
ncbi:MAG: hypothetical protein PHV07_07850 [Oscillospiraceae bacterium]|nr:hypothetical protein [Oscillospiraceae bacterium]